MINVNNEEIEIRGAGSDVIQEFCGLIKTIREEHPETLAGVISAWTDILAKDIPRLDRKVTLKVSNLASAWMKVNGVE